jgi:hypothetical protein
MAAFTLTHTQRLDNVAILQTLESTDIAIGQTIIVSGNADFNGTYIVYAVPIYLFEGVDEYGDYLFDTNEIIPNQLLVNQVAADSTRAAATGVVTWTQTCTWITNQNVLDWLGIATASANDTTFVTACTAASNSWGFRKRVEAGYHDSLSTSPTSAATLALTMYAGSLYRQRGSVDSFASFESMGQTAPTASMGEIMRLLGVNRSQVA